MAMPGRSYEAGDYRFGFNGKEMDDEVKGVGNSLDFGARIYDPRVGRWLSRDPSQAKFADKTPYEGFANNPVIYSDPDGKEIIFEVIQREGQRPLIKITVTGKVIDLSTEWFLRYSPNTLADQLNTKSQDYLRYENLYVGNRGIEIHGERVNSIDVEVHHNFEVVNTMSEVNLSDHLIVLADFHSTLEFKQDDRDRSKVISIRRGATGVTNMVGGMVSFIDADKIGYKKGLRTALHEFWRHQFLAAEDPNYNGTTSMLSESGGSGFDISPNEMIEGLINLVSGKLNIGGSYFVEKDGDQNLRIPQGLDERVHPNGYPNTPVGAHTSSGVKKVVDIKGVKEKIKNGKN